PVVGRSTVQTMPEWLPAPDCLSESVETSPKGHLRVQLRWCYPLALRHKFLHFGGTCVVRASDADWQAAFGGNPPLVINRTDLLQAVADGHAVEVNALPLFPEERPADAADLAYALPLFHRLQR
ncbi:MAG: hypothetical protein GWO24_13865, partial [Akkermansiaceae bacterium]|nr:hypothetical protein [Akkermansiaceae bacterium]